MALPNRRLQFHCLKRRKRFLTIEERKIVGWGAWTIYQRRMEDLDLGRCYLRLPLYMRRKGYLERLYRLDGHRSIQMTLTPSQESAKMLPIEIEARPDGDRK